MALFLHQCKYSIDSSHSAIVEPTYIVLGTEQLQIRLQRCRTAAAAAAEELRMTPVFVSEASGFLKALGRGMSQEVTGFES